MHLITTLSLFFSRSAVRGEFLRATRTGAEIPLYIYEDSFVRKPSKAMAASTFRNLPNTFPLLLHKSNNTIQGLITDHDFSYFRHILLTRGAMLESIIAQHTYPTFIWTIDLSPKFLPHAPLIRAELLALHESLRRAASTWTDLRAPGPTLRSATSEPR